MKEFSRRDAIKLGAGALAAASLPNLVRAKGLTGTNNIGLPLIPFTITNNTGLDLFMYAFGQVPNPPGSNPPTTYYYISDINGDVETFPVNGKNVPIGVQVPPKVTNASFPMLLGGRVYFSVGKKLIVDHPGDNGTPPIGISPNTPTPNFDSLWDFFETNWIAGGDHTVFVTNVSQANAFALAFELVLNGGTPGNPKVPFTFINGFGTGGLRAKIFADMKAAGAPWSNLIIPDPMGGVPLRVLQPYYSLTGVGPGNTGFPTDYLHDYVNNVVMPFYDKSTTNRLIASHLVGDFQWKGHTSGGQFIFEPDNAVTKTTYTFPTPNTAQIYGNTDYNGNPNDDNSRAIAAVLEASACRTTLGFFDGFPVPQQDRNLYYTKKPIFEYARILHKYAINNHCFAFQQDEVAQDNGQTNQVWNPTSFAVTIRRLD